MRKQILALALSGCLAFSATRPAYALFGAGDVVFDPTNYAQILTIAQNGIDEVETLGKLYTTAQNELQTLENVYQAFTHVTNISQLAAALNTVGADVPMLDRAVNLENALRGFGGTTNLAGQIKNLLAQTQYYHPNANDFYAQQMNDIAAARAAQLAAGQASYDAAATRSTTLNYLKAQVGSNDPKAALDLAARGSIEAAQSGAITNQILSTMVMQNGINDLQKQQIEQAQRASVDALAASAKCAADAARAGTVQLVSTCN